MLAQRAKQTASSSGQRITAVQEAGVDLCRSAIAMGLTRAMVEFVGDGVQVGLAERAEVRALGEVLPNQPVGVLVGTALPRAARGLQR